MGCTRRMWEEGAGRRGNMRMMDGYWQPLLVKRKWEIGRVDEGRLFLLCHD